MLENEKINEALNPTFGNVLLGVVWNDCPIEGCKNKVCLALNSDKCFPHTKGNRQWKLFKIWWNNLFR